MNRLLNALAVLLCGAGFIACFAHAISRGNTNETGILAIPVVLVILVLALFDVLFGEDRG